MCEYINFKEIKQARDKGKLDDAYFFIDNDYLTLEKEDEKILFRMNGSKCSAQLLKEVLEDMGFEVHFA